MERKSNNNNGNRKIVYIETYGCQMNEYDTELVKAILAKKEYEIVKNELEADVVMLNTCAIREHAHRKVYGRVHSLRHARKERAEEPPLIGLLGCMATNLRKDLLEDRSLKIDFIAGPDSYKRLPQLIEQAGVSGAKPYDLTLSEFETYEDVYPRREKGVNAWIAVMRGCNNFCTFCVVPYTRGRERSRSVDNIVEETKRLADEGFKQVTLLGQNVNSYRHENDTFADLLAAVSKVKGIERIRFTSPHPKDFPKEVIDVVAGNPKVCNHIHLPLQAGNDRVLEKMNRTYTKEEFLDLASGMKARIPGLALSTDIIVGFSGETDEEFEDTIAVMKEVEFDSAFIFKYSERKNTVAYKKFPDDVPDEVKTERTVRLNDLQQEISLKKNRAYVGRDVEALIEQEEANKSKDCMVARTDTNKLITFPKTGRKTGDLIRIRVTGATPHALKGEQIGP